MHLNRLANRLVLFIAFGLSLPVVAAAGTITFTGNPIDLQGTGFGNTLSSLALHSNGSEFGSVLWGGVADATTDDATNQSKTRTASELAGAGINASNFSLVFNLAESQGQGSDVTLFDFSLRFQDATGAALFGDLVYDAPIGGLVLDQLDNGVGGSGWLFTISLAPAEAALFFGTGTNRVGMVIAELQTIQNTSGAPDGFFFAPEPSSALLLAFGAAAACLLRFRRSVKKRVM